MVGAGLGIFLDAMLGEPRLGPHPVALFGVTMRALERRIWQNTRLSGIAYASAGTGLGAAWGVALTLVADRLGGPAWLAPAGGCYLATASRSLIETARRVEVALAAGDLESARLTLPALVGRETGQMDEKEVARAVVESVAENTVDAIVAPVVWTFFAGAPGALGYRAVNTLDAMVGHRSARYELFGWASARLDDWCGWLPARVTAVLVALVRPRLAREVARVVLRSASSHPSPNAGVAEAAYAAALGVRLGGENRYGERSEVRPFLGDGRSPELGDIERALRLCSDLSVALGTLIAAVALALSVRLAGRGCRT